jgi:acetyl esterase/lipase
MSRRTRTLFLSILPVLIAAITVSAWGQAPAEQGANWKKNPILTMVFQRYDKNNDELLNPEECDTLKKDIETGKFPLPRGVREQVLQFLAQYANRAPMSERELRRRMKAKTSLPPELAKKVIVERDVEYGRAGERPLELDLVRPKQPSDGLLPVIVFVHGGAWIAGDKSTAVPRLAALAAGGNYVCASVGYRLSGEAIWPAQIHDCKAAIRWLRANATKYNLDPNKIGVWGTSAGGHLVSLLGTSGDVKELEGDCGSADQSSRVTCVVDFCGPSDFSAIASAPRAAGPVAQLLGGSPDDFAKKAKAASPVTYVSPDDPPFLIVHGTEDNTVPLRQAEVLHETLQKAGVEVVFVKIEGGGHGIGGPEVMERVAAFFDKHLRGKNVEVSAETIRSTEPRQGPRK